MRQKGKIRSWNDDRGFGFIVPSDGGKDVFLHISAFANQDRRPEIGQIVSFAMSTDDRGRPRATQATLPGDRLARRKNQGGTVGAVIIASAFFAVLSFSVLSHKIPALIMWVYLAFSLITFLMYAFDKTAAKRDAWRIPESTLHWLSLAGGWPGALIAQQALRHKSRKQTFRMVFWFTVMINCGVTAWVYTPAGADCVKSLFDQFGININLGRTATIEWTE